MTGKWFSEYHQWWLEFLNRHAIAAHVLMLPLSVLVLVLFYTLPPLGDSNMVGRSMLQEFMRYYLFWICRIVAIELNFPNFFTLLIWGTLITIGCTYFLTCHVLLFAYRRGKKTVLTTLFACFLFYVCFIYAQGWYTERGYQSVRKYAGTSMPAIELILKCGLPLHYKIRNNGQIYAVYTNGDYEYHVDITSPSIFSTASVERMTSFWM